MGTLVCALLWAGGAMITTSPDRIITAEDLSGCYASPPVARPCERIVYRTGAMNAAFSALCGLVMIIAALWLLWELWDAVAPKPITDDFLRLLSDSFARNWRDPQDVAVVAHGLGLRIHRDRLRDHRGDRDGGMVTAVELASG